MDEPVTGPQTCSKCGQEVRYGKRDGITGWLHREAVDHMPMFGRLWTPEDSARQDAELDRLRCRPVGTFDEEKQVQPIEFYTSRGYGLKGDALKAYQAEHHPEDKVLPPVEVFSHPITPDDPLVPQGARLLAELVTGVTRVTPKGKSSKSPKHPPMAPGWELRRLTHARGPYVGANGECLSISDTIVLGARQSGLDDGYRIAVASWRDGSFDFAYTGVVKGGIVATTAANSNALKAWIKDNP